MNWNVVCMVMLIQAMYDYLLKEIVTTKNHFLSRISYRSFANVLRLIKQEHDAVHVYFWSKDRSL